MGTPVTDYSLLIAQRHVEAYSNRDKDLIVEHRVAMGCRACEDFLESGITAYRWLRQADQTLRQAAVEGFDVPEEVPQAIGVLYRAWLIPCPHAEERIKEQESRGFRLKNLSEFREACEYVRQQVRLLEMEDVLEDAYRGGVFDTQFLQDAGARGSV